MKLLKTNAPHKRRINHKVEDVAPTKTKLIENHRHGIKAKSIQSSYIITVHV